MKDKNKKSNPR